MTNEDQRVESLRKTFQSGIVRHGHPFQYAVLKAVDDLVKAGASRWVFEVSEFPVQVRDHDSKIDFILECNSERNRGEFFSIVAECKRANPAFADWVFLQAPFVSNSDEPERLVFDGVKGTNGDLEPVVSMLYKKGTSSHLGFEVHTGKKGDPFSSGRGGIEGAASQVLRGSNGLIEHFVKNGFNSKFPSAATVVPVIFTTANLWTCDSDLSAACLETGNLDIGDSEFKSVPWIWLQYHASSGLLHQFPTNLEREDVYTSTGLSGNLSRDFTRTIGVVNASGISEFLRLPTWR
jgi:hypothetical protein